MDNSILAKLLLTNGILQTQEEADLLQKSAKEKNESFLSLLIKEKKSDQLTIANFFASKFSLPLFDLDFINHEFLVDFDSKIIDKHKVLAIKKTQNTVHLLISNPTNQDLIKELKFQLNINNVIFIIVEELKLNNLIEKVLQGKSTNFVKEFEDNSDDLLMAEDDKADESSNEDDEVEEAPVVKFIQKILLEAVKLKVSDIHFEPYEKFYRVRYRLDGNLYETTKVPLALKEKIASRIKIISKLDISEKKVPQDGRTKLMISKDRAIDFRVSTLPTLFGEKIVMRILDSSAASLNIDMLGYSEREKKLLLDAVARPYGMVLVTGPTGSGKTVSLYSCVNILNKEDVNISTAEDPAEINLPGVNQVNVNVKQGLTFAEALKSFLRQDPDIILVGEIRDLETAEIAIKAAQTGHLVLSTLHTNDAPTTLTRLMNMGIAPFNIASAIILITAQRLARRLCPHCKEKEDIPEQLLLSAGFNREELKGYKTDWFCYKPVGCPECNDKGYKGRVGVYQVMPISEEIQRIILTQGTAMDIAAQSRAEGVLTLREAGLQKVKQGITSLSEIENCTNL